LEARNGHTKTAKILLEQGDADPNHAKKYDRTLLGWAAILGHEGAVKRLLGREDVDPDHPDVGDRTPLG